MDGREIFGKQRPGIFLKKLAGLIAVSKDSRNRSLFQQPWNISRNYIADTAVRRTDNFTALNHVPNGNPMAEQKLFFSGYWQGQALS